MSTTTATITEFATIAFEINRQLEEVTPPGLYPFDKPFNEIYEAIDEWASWNEPNGNADLLLPITVEEKISAWLVVGYALSENWQEEWNEKYPFHLDFTEMLAEISRWAEEPTEG